MADEKNLENSILNSAMELENSSSNDLKKQTTNNLEDEMEISSEEFANNLELEKKYGDSPLTTAALTAGSELSFGLLPQVLKKFGFATEQDMREYVERNPNSATAGQILGIAGPLLASGGTSAVAKGVSKAGAGVIGASKLGQGVTKGVAAALKSSSKDKLLASISKKALSEGAGSAVEAVPYALSQTLQEDALGTAEFNADNLIANVGLATAFAGGAGGLFGTAQALIPVIKNKKVVDVVSKKVKTNADLPFVAAELSGFSTSQITKLKATRKDVYDNLPDYYAKKLNLETGDSTKSIYQKNEKMINTLDEEIKETLKKVDDIAQPNVRVTRKELAEKVHASLETLKEEFQGIKGLSAKGKLERIELEKADWDDWLDDVTPISGKELNRIKQKHQGLSRYDKKLESASLDDVINRKVASGVREKVSELADRVSTADQNLGKQLRDQNLNISTALKIKENIAKKADKDAASKLGKLKDIFLGNFFLGADQLGLGAATIGAKKYIESDLRRKIQILGSVDRANRKINIKVGSSIKDFFTKAKKTSIPTSTKILLNTSFNPEKKETSKTKKEAYKRISKELTELNANPEKLVSHIARNNLRVTNSAPQTAQVIDNKMVKAVQFLHEKLPKTSAKLGMMQNLTKADNYTPSTLELAKFERYVEGVIDPMSALNDLESGKLSREKVEAIKFVYPDLYNRIQDKTMEFITQNADKVSYSKRLQIGILLNIPSDTSLVPENLQKLQQNFAPQEEQQQQQSSDGAVNTTQGGLENLTFAQDVKTPTQKVSER